jgi:type IV secretory pathway TraG/TraD family ATPase VirD4
VPWLLEHDGPALVTSTKGDIAGATRRWRDQLGEVLVWDPFNGGTMCWTPLEGCEDWGVALRQAHWLADAADEGADHGAARFWNEEAAKLLGPLLHAAALAGADMATVIRWLDRQSEDEPVDILRSDGAAAAQDQLDSILLLDPRNRSTNFMSAGHLLAAYRYPEVLATSQPGFRPAELVEGAHTLYLCASDDHQRLLAPLVKGILSAVLHSAKARARQRGEDGPLLRVLLDEVAQIAPLADLQRHIADARGQGIRFATFWQSVAQIHERYRAGAATILGSSTTKLYMGPVGDEQTRREITGLLGDEPDPGRPGDRRPVATPQELAQLDRDRAVLLAGANAPAMVRLDPYWEIKGVADRADRPRGGQPARWG